MPMSIEPVFHFAVAIAVSTPAQRASWVTIRTSVKRPSSALSVEPGLNPNQPSHRMKMPRPNSGMLCPGIARGLPSGPSLPLRGPWGGGARQRAGRTDQVYRRGAGEVLHAEVVLQPAAAEDPAREDRVDQRGEDDRVQDVHAGLDALQRRA